MSRKTFEFRILTSKWEQGLVDLFNTLRITGDDKYFHPHPLTKEEAKKLCNYSGKDLYYVCVKGKQVFGYGMLRGWDEGYVVPSLGIVIHPEARNMGLGKAFISFLYVVAYQKKAKRIRIKVHINNRIAMKLYKKSGYKFKMQENEQHIGFLNL